MRLAEAEVRQGNLSGTVSAVTEGLAIEKSQYVGINFAHLANFVMITFLECYFDVMWHQ
jgi:hypothetical protein